MCPLLAESLSQSPNVASLLMTSSIPPNYRAGSGARSRRRSLVSLIILGDLPITDRKIHEGFATYKSNTGVPHPLSGSTQLSKRATGSDPLTDDNAHLWFGTISVGTPPVNFTGITFLHDDSKPLTDPRHDTVDFDTGSSDLFLPSPSCDSNCSGHKQYNPGASSTAQNLSKPFSLAFGDGATVDGDQFTDVVSIAGLTV
jgi:cathepsin D